MTNTYSKYLTEFQTKVYTLVASRETRETKTKTAMGYTPIIATGLANKSTIEVPIIIESYIRKVQKKTTK